MYLSHLRLEQIQIDIPNVLGLLYAQSPLPTTDYRIILSEALRPEKRKVRESELTSDNTFGVFQTEVKLSITAQCDLVKKPAFHKPYF